MADFVRVWHLFVFMLLLHLNLTIPHVIICRTPLLLHLDLVTVGSIDLAIAAMRGATMLLPQLRTIFLIGVVMVMKEAVVVVMLLLVGMAPLLIKVAVAILLPTIGLVSSLPGASSTDPGASSTGSIDQEDGEFQNPGYEFLQNMDSLRPPRGATIRARSQ